MIEQFSLPDGPPHTERKKNFLGGSRPKKVTFYFFFLSTTFLRLCSLSSALLSRPPFPLDKEAAEHSDTPKNSRTRSVLSDRGAPKEEEEEGTRTAAEEEIAASSAARTAS